MIHVRQNFLKSEHKFQFTVYSSHDMHEAKHIFEEK